jgi:hypothetical protein
MTAVSLAVFLASGLLATALPSQVPFATGPGPCVPTNAIKPGGVYSGTDKPSNEGSTGLRISNGSAGLSGLVGRLADKSIDYEMNRARLLLRYAFLPDVRWFFEMDYAIVASRSSGLWGIPLRHSTTWEQDRQMLVSRTTKLRSVRL